MKEMDLARLSKEELINLIKVYARLFLALDGFWFLEVEKKFGYEAALEMDTKAWEGYFPYEARLLRKTLGIKEEGIPGIIETLKQSAFVPCMEQKIEEVSEKRGVFALYKCPSLEAMERAGRKEFTCEPVGTIVFQKYAESIDPRVKVRFLDGPPRKSPEDVSCKWEFALEEDM
ncbi:MAG: DUF6125 family protein [Thermodesulfobacteriota bacterium]